MEAPGHYLVELHRPPAGWEALQQLSAEARACAERLSAEGTSVRFLRSIFVPEKDSCFLLYEGVSADAVGEAARRAALAFAVVTSAVPIVRPRDDRIASAHGRGMEPRQMPAPAAETTSSIAASPQPEGER